MCGVLLLPDIFIKECNIHKMCFLDNWLQLLHKMHFGGVHMGVFDIFIYHLCNISVNLKCVDKV